MRLIAGKYKGRRLQAPSGKHIRPTTDRMRETLFNLLQNSIGLEFDGLEVLDAFAGTGALGLEALSRGAAHVTFADKDRRSLLLVKENIALLKAEEQCRCLGMDAIRLPVPDHPYGLVFLDPPYHKNLIWPTIDNLLTKDALADGCVLVTECAGDEQPDLPEGFEELMSRTYGDSKITVLKFIK
ncbi:16S rRNA (guanine(966)-N(2))-methyltransferase RsmD [Emcibacter nanhaiensis]|uniref:16S rRNA (Guanine(966)-N(2))-methyltransferase RsmD n=1 Tax=Emcibacter nanhaiensis TaxID=1505037 RepID=A0A501PP75_9PROT|nr:16S rRNA (guanine(966)-N(2))-methyltransferase RsmD [Emcibacter nanhaiensis]TPD61902.1 16S rRNA (guanine(966)-N(2))-methyltransferase RsmD [Emcibacter nanhaiensis]